MASPFEGFRGDECELMRNGDYGPAEKALCRIRDGVLESFRQRGPKLNVHLVACAFNKDALYKIAWAMLAPPASDTKQEARRAQLGVLLWCDFPKLGDAYKIAFRLQGPQGRKGRNYPTPPVTTTFLSADPERMCAFANKNGVTYDVTQLRGLRGYRMRCKPTQDFAKVKAACQDGGSYKADYNAVNIARNRPFDEVKGMGGDKLTEDAYDILSKIATEFREILESDGY